MNAHRTSPERLVMDGEARRERRKQADLHRTRAHRPKDTVARQKISDAFAAYAEEHGFDLVFFAGLAELITYAPKLNEAQKASAKSKAESVFMAQGEGG